jgi:hypothetical protein
MMRADDNGRTALVAEVTGHANARAHLADYEKKAHKQTYWLDVA